VYERVMSRKYICVVHVHGTEGRGGVRESEREIKKKEIKKE